MDKRLMDEAAQQRAAFSRMMLSVNTAIPGVIEAWNATTCLATVRPAIRLKVQRDNQTQYMDLPAVENVPACLPHSAAAGLFVTVPVRVGDSCLLIFAQRAIDNFVQYGGIQNPMTGENPALSEPRHHSLTDAIFIPNILTVPHAIENWADDAIVVRNAAGTVKLAVKSDAVYITGDVHVTGNITATQEITAGTIPLSTHKHTGVQTGGGTTGGPTT
jgi:hypothetical protein